jgi:3-deoxy-D-manno-octulosonic-acid transferase
MIEPAAFGIPVAFGPNTDNFRQLVEELIVHDAATVVRDQAEMQRFVKRVFDDRAWAAETGTRAKNVVLNHVGASQRTIECLTGLLQKSSSTLTPVLTDSRAA